MAWSRLALYNVAMACLGERPLDSLTENAEARRKLDEIYTRGAGVISWAMENGHWNFAMRAVKIDSESGLEPAFGFNFIFTIPSDFRKLNMISAGENFDMPLNEFEEEAGFWYTFVDPLYVRYVSDDVDYGADFGKWTDTFALWLGAWMALQIAPGVLNDTANEALNKKVKRLLVEARSNDAMNEPTRFPPLSSWASARYGGRVSRRDRGSRSTLLG